MWQTGVQNGTILLTPVQPNMHIKEIYKYKYNIVLPRHVRMTRAKGEYCSLMLHAMQPHANFLNYRAQASDEIAHVWEIEKMRTPADECAPVSQPPRRPDRPVGGGGNLPLAATQV